MDILKNSRLEKVFESVIFSLVGFILFLLSFFDLLTLCYTLAGITLLVGIFYLFGFFWMLKDNNQALLSRSIILILLSLIIVFFYEQFTQIFIIVIAIFLFYNAITHFSFTLDIKTINEHHWKIDLIYSLILFILGVFFIVIGGTNTLELLLILKISGIIYLLFGITKIILLLKVHPSYNKR